MLINSNMKDDIQLPVIATGFAWPKSKDQYGFVNGAVTGHFSWRYPSVGHYLLNTPGKSSDRR